MEDLNQRLPDFKPSALNHSATLPPIKYLSLFLRKRRQLNSHWMKVVWLVPSTPERAVQVRALARDIVLCSWARHLTLHARETGISSGLMGNLVRMQLYLFYQRSMLTIAIGTYFNPVQALFYLLSFNVFVKFSPRIEENLVFAEVVVYF